MLWTPPQSRDIGECIYCGRADVVLQKKAPATKVVKAFNTVFAQHMATGQVKGTALTLFAAGDDQDARN